jgi:hypothetical protein
MQLENSTTRRIHLPKGGILEVEVTPEFLEKIKVHFNLSSALEVDDQHIRMFVYGAFKNAVDKAEKEAMP